MRGNGGIDPSNLHLKKELSQILKATRVLRDPGTSSTCRSPLYSVRTLTKIHYDNFQKNGCLDGNIVVTPSASPSQQFLQLPFQLESKSSNYSNIGKFSSSYEYDKGNVKDKEKRVFLCNWRSRESESGAITHSDEDGEEEEDSTTDEGSSLLDCWSNDARNGGKISEIKRGGIRKSKSTYRSNVSLKEHEQKKILLNRWSWNRTVADGLEGSRVGRNKLDSLVGESDYTEDFCDSESLRGSAASSLLSEIKNRNWTRSQMKLRGGRVEGDSDSYSIEALSKRSYKEYRTRNFSTNSFNEADAVDDDQLDFLVSQGCGIPCYNWPKTSMLKSRLASASCFSPSVSDTLRKQLYGTQAAYCRRHHGLSSSSNKKLTSRTMPRSHVPLLNNSDDETNLDELHDQDGGVGSLSEKYRPDFFDELIGQSTVVQSLLSAILKGKISPFYLFHGPRGTGKSSTARIFAAALNCLAAKESKPCAMCKECVNFVSEKSKYLIEIDGSNKKGICDISSVLRNFLVVHPYDLHGYKTIVVNDCHLLPSKAWLMLLQLVEKPLPPGVVFVFIMTDADSVPHALLSSCQKKFFDKISILNIVAKLRKIAGDENLDAESDALELIASNADGSLRNAETMLDQLSLFGKRITVSLVNDLMGVVSDDKLLELLDLAMSSNANETVIKARELLGSGIDPSVLTSQMLSLIDPGNSRSIFGGRSLSESEKDKLRNALTVISEAEKHLRVSSQPSAWFMAILLQLGSLNSPYQNSSEAHHRVSFKATEDHASRPREPMVPSQRSKAWLASEMAGSPTSSAMDTGHSNSKLNQVSTTKVADFFSDPYKSNSRALQDIWLKCIEKCRSKTLQLLLQSHGNLVSLSETKAGRFVAHISFRDDNTKRQAEAFLNSITNSFEVVLRRNVDVQVQVILLPDPVSRISTDNNTVTNLESRSTCLNILTRGSETGEEPSKVSRRSFRVCRSPEIEPLGSAYGNTNTSTSKLNEISTICRNMLAQHQEEKSKVDMTALNIEDGIASQKHRLTNRTDHIPVSPCLSCNPNLARNLSKDNTGYESGSGRGGCTGLLCWRGTKPHRKVKAKQDISTRPRTRKGILCFGKSAVSRRMENLDS